MGIVQLRTTAANRSDAARSMRAVKLVMAMRMRLRMTIIITDAEDIIDDGCRSGGVDGDSLRKTRRNTANEEVTDTIEKRRE